MALSDIPISAPTHYILGSSGFAGEIKAYLIDYMHIAPDNIVFVDDNSNDAISISEYHARVNKTPSAVSIMGSGKPDIKRRMSDQIKEPIFKLVLPTSSVANSSSVENGSVVAPGAVVSPNVAVGKHVLINTNSSIGHDSVIHDYCVVSPNAAIGGWSTINEGAYIGAGAIVRERLTIGKDAVVGMGAVVTKDVQDGIVVVGNPAKIFLKNRRLTNG